MTIEQFQQAFTALNDDSRYSVDIVDGDQPDEHVVWLVRQLGTGTATIKASLHVAGIGDIPAAEAQSLARVIYIRLLSALPIWPIEENLPEPRFDVGPPE